MYIHPYIYIYITYKCNSATKEVFILETAEK